MDPGLEGRVQGSALVKYKACAFKMGVAANFEVFPNAPIELVNVCYTIFLHENRGFFAANARLYKGLQPSCPVAHHGDSAPLWEFGDFVDASIDSVFENAWASALK